MSQNHTSATQVSKTSRRIADETIITGSAVVLDIHPASPILRIGATIADIVLGGFTTLVALILVSQVYLPDTQSLFRISQILLMVAVMILIPATIEYFTQGQSLGKWAFGIRVRRDDGGVVGVRHVFMRHLVGILEVWMSFGAIALISSMVAPHGKRLGDLAAGTVVMAEPQARRSRPLIMPPELAQWANTAHILPLSPQLQAQVNAFLGANREMIPQLRETTAQAFASEVSTRVTPMPPEGTHPERFLAAVMVVLRDREWRRLQAQEAAMTARREALQGSVGH